MAEQDASEAISAPAPAVTLPEPQDQLAFDGVRKPLFWLLLRNLLLTIVTLGIYRFWARTRVRQFFWRHTRLLGEPLEYLGTGGELFVGFLIAIVILVPMGAIYSLLQFFVVGSPFHVTLAIDAVYYTLIAFLIQVAIHRMRRYRLTRTAWRGVRFGLDGSSIKYALISFGYGFLSLITLWLAHPWLRVATMKYFLNNARFGTASLSLEASGRWLFRRWLIVGIPFVLGAAIFYWINGQVFVDMMALDAKSAGGDDVGDEALRLFARIQYWPIAIFVLSSVISVWYSVVEFRYMLGGIRIGEVSVTSEMPVGFVYRVYFVFWLSMILVLGIVGAGIAALIGLSSPALAAILPVLLIFGFLGLYGILRTLFVDVTLLKRLCATLSIANPQALDNVIQSSADLPGHGEGLADALDVGGF